ncbi:hypothetical protein PhCBS80983_g00925 [Powellomyces hirtus]|uniref:RRM domain-containing protein n=1 Tax=Powellomyces hirtus TaxID=109895 RepID=A0A507ECV7_9FUNG|nr:hypothetical protein PhCBS80983_g00925 [Powellomyces hirtus]
MASLYAALEQPTTASAETTTTTTTAAGGAEPAKKKVVVPAGWSAAQRLLQPIAIKRKPPATTVKPRALRDVAKWQQAAASLVEPRKVKVEMRGNENAGGQVEIPQMSDQPRNDVQEPKRNRRNGKSNMDNEEIYEPSKPNDYYQFKRETKRRKAAERAMEHDAQDRWTSGDDHHRGRPSHSHHHHMPPPVEEVYRSRAASPVRQQPAATPTPLVHPTGEAASGEEAYMRRMRMAAMPAPVPPAGRQQSPPGHPPHHPSNNGSHHPHQPQPPHPRSQTHATQLPGSTTSFAAPIDFATHVVLLTNMVGSGQVDADLQHETADECSRFGRVERCVVYELPYQAPDNEAVRIFVEFSDISSAKRAQAELNGRFFGGRVVTASFYNMQRFRQQQYE